MTTTRFSSNEHRPLTVVDLFSGAGGTGLGFLRAGFTILAAVEVDGDAAATYAHNLGVRPIQSDIREISPEVLREDLKLERGDLDVLVGCPPCQGFTRMRNASGADDPRNDLVLVYAEFVREFRPRFVVFENVPGLVRSRHGRVYYNRLRSALEEMGYAVVAREVDAADYGVPQHRKRIIITAGRDGEEPPDIARARTHGPPGSPEVLSGLLERWKTVGDTIKRYPPLKAGEENPAYPNHKARRIGERVLSFIRKVPKDGGSRTDVPEEYWLACHKRHRGHKDVYGRLAWDRPANVITSGCTNVSKGRFVHPEQNRGLSLREAAALQGFPDDFVFVGGMDSISAQIGNAVPPPLAEAIAKLLRDRLLGVLGTDIGFRDAVFFPLMHVGVED